MRIKQLLIISVFVFLSSNPAFAGFGHHKKDGCDPKEHDLGCFCSGDGHLESLQFIFQGADCDASDHRQSKGSVFCTGDSSGYSDVRILASTKTHWYHKKYSTTFDGELKPGHSFQIYGTYTKHKKISPTTYIYIYSLSGKLLQVISFHTSCSEPLEVGDQFGGIILQSGVRNGKTLVDACGVCGGDGSSCVDCLGIPNGGARIDACGVCNGNNACVDCADTVYGTAVVDECGICGGDGSTCRDCAGVIGGSATVDQCGVCGGSNECLDCNGTPYGSAKPDSCGICGGSNECLDCPTGDCDCFGTPGGTAVIDQCGVCGGSNECIDCLGDAFGSAKLDDCGVCNGGNACIDCKGIPFGVAKLDRCGECGGDGSSCVECSNVNINEVRGAIDGNGFAIKATILQALKVLKRSTSKKDRKLIKEIQQSAKDNYINIWKIAYSFPEVLLQCEDSPFCINVSQEEDLSKFKDSIDVMDELLVRVNQKYSTAKRARKSRRKEKKLKKLQKQFYELKDEALNLVASIPQTVSQCL